MISWHFVHFMQTFFYKFRLKQKKLDLTTEATLNSPHGTQRQEILTGHLGITVGLHS